MSWQQWPAAPLPGSGMPPVNSAPPVINPAQNVSNNMQYTPEQWQQMQQQNWQQWAQWQQQYQQWHQQYGAEYQKSLNAMAGTPTAPVAPAATPYVHTAPPPLPPEVQPPPPPDDPPLPTTNYYTTTTAPPNYNTNNQRWKNQNMSVPPPNINNPPKQETTSSDFGTKRPFPNQNNFQDNKRNKFDQDWQARNHGPNPTPNPQPVNKAIANQTLEELTETEKKFMKQFSEWEAQFNKWKEQNEDHPDKEQYKEYEKKWETWRNQLLDRREQMRRRRLGLTGANNSPQPPSMQTRPVQSNKQPTPTPLMQNMIQPNEILGANLNKPPPHLNNEPLQFKAHNMEANKPTVNTTLESDIEIVENEKMSEESNSFFRANTSGGIPGLDLVESSDSKDETIDNTKNQTDFEALSKNINSILGDQKLLSMLNMVTKNQKPFEENPIKTDVDSKEARNFMQEEDSRSKQSWNDIEASRHSMGQWEDNDYAKFEKDDNQPYKPFDDYSRFSASDIKNKKPGLLGPDPNTRNSCPTNEQFTRPPNFVSNNTLGSNNINFKPNNFKGNSFGPDDNYKDSDNFREDNFRDSNPNARGVEGNLRGADSYSRGSDIFRDSNDRFGNFREPDNTRVPDDNFKGPTGGNLRGPDGNFRGPDGNFRGPEGNFRGPDVNFRGPDGNFRGSDSNFRGPEGNFRGPDGNLRVPEGNFRGPDGNFRGPDGNIRGPDGSFRGPEGNFRGPDSDFRGPERNFRGSDNNFRGPDGNFGGPGNNFRGPNLREHDGFRGPDNYSGFPRNSEGSFRGPDGNLRNSESNFRGSEGNVRGPDVNIRGPDNNFRGQGGNIREPDNNFPGAENNFRSGNFKNNDRFQGPDKNFGNAGRNFQTPDNFKSMDNYRDSESTSDDRRPFKPSNTRSGSFGNQDDTNENFQDSYSEQYMETDYQIDNNTWDKSNSGFPYEDRNWDNEEYPTEDPFPSEFDPENIENEPKFANEVPATDDILTIENVTNYEHKSKKPAIIEVTVEPPCSFDYRHKPVNRVPIPERPKWLSKTFRNIPEFEPSLGRPLIPAYSRYPVIERFNYRSGPSLERYDDYNKYNRRPQDEPHNRRFDERKRNEKSPKREFDYRGSPNSRDQEYKNKRENFNRNSYNKFISNNKETFKPSNVFHSDDVFNPPGRFKRAPKIIIILRGPPGSGKTYLAKLMKDKEMENGGSAPRILSLDDYFMVEQEKEITEDGKKVKIKEMVYEYEECMEQSYKTSLLKSFKKTVTDGYFPFIIVDDVNDKIKHFNEMWSFGRENGFQVYICQLEFDLQTCSKRNIHGRTEESIGKIISSWEETPNHFFKLDATNLIQAASIPEVEMEEINSPNDNFDDDHEEQACNSSKWDNFECSINNLAKLDGINKPLRSTRTMEDYLQLEEWTSRTTSKPGQKRVRWADLEECKEQEKMRAIGFVVGQTDWGRMMDPTQGSSALTQTKFIERVHRY